MLIYIAKSTAILATLLLFYKLFLEKESVHVFKRYFLLAAVIVSIVIPAITFTTYIEAQPIFETTPVDLPINFEVVEEVPKTDYLAIALWSLYGLGVVFFGIRFLLNLSKLFVKIKRNERLKTNSFINVLISDLLTPHTFFKYIFFNKDKFKLNVIPKEVEIHEQAHAKQLHSIDVILVELLQVVFWFNPFVYLLKNYVKLNHEFLADKAVLDAGTDLRSYQNTLLAYSYTHNQYPIANAINYSSIKKRFTIMKTKTSLKNSWLKSALLLPLVTVLIYGFSTKETVTERQIINEDIKENNTSKIHFINEDTIYEADSLTIKDIQEKLEEINGKNINYSDLKNKNFSISLKLNKNRVEMTCNEGCAWTKLSFDINDNDSQAVDEFGMTDMSKYKNKMDSEFSNFMFLVQKEKNKVELKGIEGTFWNKLTATLHNRDLVMLNKSGVFYNTYQTKATPEQMKEYDKLATFYSSKPWSETVVKLKDVKRMKTLRNLMSAEQKKSAKPFPNLPPPPSSRKDKQDALKNYQIKNDSYEKLRNEKPHFVKKSKAEQEKMHKLFSDLGGMYFRLSKENKRKAKRPIKPHHPYLMLKSGDTYYYKLKSELTEEDKMNIPPPPPPPPMHSKKVTNKGSKELKKLAENFEKTAKEYGKMVRDRKVKKISYDVLNKKHKEVVKIHKKYMELATKEKVLFTPPPPPPPSANKKTGYKTINNERLYYVETNGKRQYYNKYGDNVNVIEVMEGPQKGETLTITEVNEYPTEEIEIVEEIQEEPIEIIEVVEEELEEIQEKSTRKNPIYSHFFKKMENENAEFYIDGKKASKNEVYNLNHKNIKELHVKRIKEIKEIHITTK